MTHAQLLNDSLDILFLALQGFVVAFLVLHDWIPLGRLNNVTAMRGKDRLTHRVFVTLLGALPAAACLYFSAKYFGQAGPHWLVMLLWITYGLFFVGLLRAWWIPYLIVPDERRAARYQGIFAGTHSFLPVRNGIVPDTLHTALHIGVVAMMVVLWLRDGMMMAG
jgi:hypothetical protein